MTGKTKPKFDFLKDGEIGLIMVDGDRITQLGISKEQYPIITSMLGIISKSEPFVKMGEEYDLVLRFKNETKNCWSREEVNEILNRFAMHCFNEAKEAILWVDDYPMKVKDKWMSENL